MCKRWCTLKGVENGRAAVWRKFLRLLFGRAIVEVDEWAVDKARAVLRRWRRGCEGPGRIWSLERE